MFLLRETSPQTMSVFFVISWIFTVSCLTELLFYRHVRCSVVSTSTSIRHWIQTYFIHQRSHPTYTCCMKYGKQYVEYEAYLMATVQNFDNFYCNKLYYYSKCLWFRPAWQQKAKETKGDVTVKSFCAQCTVLHQ